MGCWHRCACFIQIHAEAKERRQVISYSQAVGSGRDGRRGSKPVDEWQDKGRKERERESREKFDGTKVVGILAKHGDRNKSTKVRWALY